MIDWKILRRAMLVGALFEALFVATGRFAPGLRPYLMFGCMLIAGVMGLLYGRDLARGFVLGALGGAAAGALCGVVAVLLASLLGEHPDLYLPYGVMVLAFTGAVGGLFGQVDAMIKAFLRTLK